MDEEFEQYLDNLGRLFIQAVLSDLPAHVLYRLGGIFVLAAPDLGWLREGARPLWGLGRPEHDVLLGRARTHWQRHRLQIEQRIARGETPEQALVGFFRDHRIARLQTPAEAEELHHHETSLWQDYSATYPVWQREFAERGYDTHLRLQALPVLTGGLTGNVVTTGHVIINAEHSERATGKDWANASVWGEAAQQVADLGEGVSDIREQRQALRDVGSHSVVDPRGTTVVVSAPGGDRPADAEAVRSVAPSARLTRPSDRRAPIQAIPVPPTPPRRSPGRRTPAANAPVSGRARQPIHRTRVTSRPRNAERLGSPPSPPSPTPRRRRAPTRNVPDETTASPRRTIVPSSRAEEPVAAAQEIDLARSVTLEDLMQRALLEGPAGSRPTVAARTRTLQEIRFALRNTAVQLQNLYERIGEVEVLADLLDLANHQAAMLVSTHGGLGHITRQQRQGYESAILGRVAEAAMRLDFRADGYSYAVQIMRQVRLDPGSSFQIVYASRAYTGAGEISDGLQMALIATPQGGRSVMLLSSAESKASIDRLRRSFPRSSADRSVRNNIQLERMMQRFGAEPLVFELQGAISRRNPTGAAGSQIITIAGSNVIVHPNFAVFYAVPSSSDDPRRARSQVGDIIAAARDLGVRIYPLKSPATATDLRALARVIFEAAVATQAPQSGRSSGSGRR